MPKETPKASDPIGREHFVLDPRSLPLGSKSKV